VIVSLIGKSKGRTNECERCEQQNVNFHTHPTGGESTARLGTGASTAMIVRIRSRSRVPDRLILHRSNFGLT
jgi:hypothetical protein